MAGTGGNNNPTGRGGFGSRPQDINRSGPRGGQTANTLIRETAQEVLAQKTKGVGGKLVTKLEKMLGEQALKACAGDTKACELMLKVGGWAPTTEITGPGGLPVGLTMKDWVDKCAREKAAG